LFIIFDNHYMFSLLHFSYHCLSSLTIIICFHYYIFPIIVWVSFDSLKWFAIMYICKAKINQ